MSSQPVTRLVSLLLAMAGVCLAAQAPPPSARAPHVVFVTGDDEYRSEISMPMIAAILEKRHGLRTSVAYARPAPQTKDHIEGLEALDTADLMVMFTRYRALPDAELNRILAYVKSGKPLVGFRTRVRRSPARSRAIHAPWSSWSRASAAASRRCTASSA